ncbi:MAG: asparaginase [Anaerolineae bacterium]
MKKQVYIAYTGGTIGMRRTAHGYAPASGFLQQQMLVMPELADPVMPKFVINEYAPLLDSSNMVAANWIEIAEDIRRHYDDYDGFVVIHGTDTMAYTASALPFILQGLHKPIVVTGSQIPLCEVRSDGRHNLLTSLLIAAYSEIPEVCLFFGTKLLRGCRAVKVNADGLDAFESPNYPLLGQAGVEITLYRERVLQPGGGPGPLNVKPLTGAVVGTLGIFPGISAEVVRNTLMQPLQGLVLETYGAGNAPDKDPALTAALAEATARGVVVVNCTQCLIGGVRMGTYATGSALARAGVISGYDMTREAALSKLFVLFSSGATPDEVKAQMQVSLCGELTRQEPGPAEHAPVHPVNA